MTSERCYSTEEQIHRTGFVIERFSEIERFVNDILFDFIAPTTDAESFVKANVLDNSIISFGSKLKLLQVINRDKKAALIDAPKWHRLLSIRNAFAHNNVSFKLDLETKEIGLSDIYYFVDSMKGDGQLQRSKRDDLYIEFNQLYEELRTKLQQLLTVVNTLS